MKLKEFYMPDMERLTDKISVDLAKTNDLKQYNIGFIAGKKAARIEMLIFLVCLYFIVAIIGKQI